MPVYPDGDYAFLSEDFAEGTFGPPWGADDLCHGERLADSVGHSRATWLPIKRRDGSIV